jgi:endonuclease/exonuclease/phosphatase family metal-dependent hydrolase
VAEIVLLEKFSYPCCMASYSICIYVGRLLPFFVSTILIYFLLKHLALRALDVCPLPDTIDCPSCVLQHQSDRRRDQKKLRIVAFNPEWLFIGGGHGNVKCPGYRCTWKTKSEGQVHLYKIAKVLRALRPDIVHLSEVEDCRVLHNLIQAIGDHALHPYMVLGIDTALGQNVGLLTKVDPLGPLLRSSKSVSLPIPNSQCPSGKSRRTRLSKHYIARLNLRGTNITIIGLHLIAQTDSPDRCVKREGQALIARSIIDQIPPTDQVIVLGDFNDHDNKAVGVDGRLPLSPALDLIKNGPRRLFNVAELMPRSERYSSWWDANGNCRDDGDKEHTLIDHVLVSEGLREQISNVFIAHSYKGACGKRRISDHWPLIVDFVLK